MSEPVKSEEEEYYTVDEVARKLKTTPRAVRAWIKAKKLKAARPGGRVLRIKKTDFEIYVGETK